MDMEGENMDSDVTSTSVNPESSMNITDGDMNISNTNNSQIESILSRRKSTTVS